MKLRDSIKDTIIKSFITFVACIGFGLAMAMMYKANIGADPGTVLTQGLVLTFGGNFTVTYLIFSIVLIAIGMIFDRKLLYFATVITSIFTGIFIDVFEPILEAIFPGELSNFPFQLVMLLVAFAILGISIALYLPLDFGASSIDCISLTYRKILNKKTIWIFVVGYIILVNVFCFIIGDFTNGIEKLLFSSIIPTGLVLYIGITFDGSYAKAMWVAYLSFYAFGNFFGGTVGIGTMIGLVLPGLFAGIMMPHFEKLWGKLLGENKPATENAEIEL